MTNSPSADPGSWHRREETWARQVAASWLGHPVVREVVEAAAVHAGQLVAPLAPHMDSQVEITRFCWQIWGIAPAYPDGTIGANPFDPAQPGAWDLTDAEREAAGHIAAVFHHLVLQLLPVLEQNGVKATDTGWTSDQVVLAVLLLLTADGYELDWDNPRHLAEQLQPPGVTALSPDGRAASARDGRSDEMARNADRIRKTVRERAGADTAGLRRPYNAAGGPRAVPQSAALRREVLARLRSDHPDATVPLILQTWDHSDRTLGGRVRTELAHRHREAGLQAPDKPSRSALYADFEVLDAQQQTATSSPQAEAVAGGNDQADTTG